MSGHCPRCGVYAEEDDDRLCASCKGDRATPQPPTLDELRDWHAKRAGWVYEPEQTDGMGHCCSYWWKYTISPKHGGRTYSPTHPFPATLDGAASAMLEGWGWWKGVDRWRAIVAAREYEIGVCVDDTGNKVYDLYLLAKLAHEKEATP